MCATCGCNSGAKATVHDLESGSVTTVDSASDAHAHATHHSHEHGHAHHHHHDAHDHGHGHEHGHEHEHVHADGTRHSHTHDHDNDHDHHHHGHDAHEEIALEAQLLAKNDALAARNRAWFAGREILAVNLVSSPGAGKTTLLERTIRDIGSELAISVIEGDQATSRDGERIRAAGARAVQVNTGTGCHLEADMVAQGLKSLRPATGSVVLIENVGNLVCPALFDLGERAKVAILSVTEGDDKPLKYPHMFRAAEIVILNKIDLLPHVDFDVAAAIGNALKVNPHITVLRLSARTGEGLDAWYSWLRRESAQAREAALI
jgi:hydrogenase nickel incorporation protein HypB